MKVKCINSVGSNNHLIEGKVYVVAKDCPEYFILEDKYAAGWDKSRFEVVWKRCYTSGCPTTTTNDKYCCGCWRWQKPLEGSVKLKLPISRHNPQ
jgi:hypothetical protein